jgi:hypothetical protein
MKKESLIITVSILFFACGSNAENQTIKELEIVNNTEEVLSEKKKSNEFENQNILTKTIKEEKQDESLEQEYKPVEPNQVQVKETLLIIEESNAGDKEFKQLEVKVLMVDHDAWNLMLKKNVGTSGKVNYKGMKASLSGLEKYLKYLKENAPKSEWSKNEKLAYWINLYNASTVHLIVSNYPTSSITKLSGGKPWDKKFVKSGDKIYSLNQIENEIVRPRFNDPRIHAALNCAAVSCPNLLNEAFTASALNNQLNKQSKVWANDVTKNKLEGTKVKVSQIFDWYAADFKAGGGVVAFINKYADTKVSSKAKVSYLEYNWALNE